MYILVCFLALPKLKKKLDKVATHPSPRDVLRVIPQKQKIPLFVVYSIL